MGEEGEIEKSVVYRDLEYITRCTATVLPRRRKKREGENSVLMIIRSFSLLLSIDLYGKMQML